MTTGKYLFRLTTAAAFAAVFAAATCAAAADGSQSGKLKLTLSTGVDYSSGDYGQSVDTQITYAPVTAKMKLDRWTGKLTVPYISITGPGVVIGGSDGTTAGTPAAKSTQRGLGDVTASLAYTAPLLSARTKGTLTGKVKFPTADETRNLGTGEFDYTLQAAVMQDIADAYVTGSVARKFNGSSARFNLDDVWKFSLGAGYSLTPELTAGINYDYRQAATRTGTAASEANAFISRKLGDDWSVQVYADAGFTDASPNWGGGLQLSYQFDAFDITGTAD